MHYRTLVEDEIEIFRFYVVTVPTPTFMDKNKRPVLTPLIKASESVGKVLKKEITLSMRVQYIPGLLKMNVFLYLSRFLV